MQPSGRTGPSDLGGLTSAFPPQRSTHENARVAAGAIVPAKKSPHCFSSCNSSCLSFRNSHTKLTAADSCQTMPAFSHSSSLAYSLVTISVSGCTDVIGGPSPGGPELNCRINTQTTLIALPGSEHTLDTAGAMPCLEPPLCELLRHTNDCNRGLNSTVGINKSLSWSASAAWRWTPRYRRRPITLNLRRSTLQATLGWAQWSTSRLYGAFGLFNGYHVRPALRWALCDNPARCAGRTMSPMEQRDCR